MLDETAARRRSGWSIAALSLGTLLNPLNSSMIAVALVPLQHDLGVDVTSITWVITSFYLASAAGQPLMGRLGDRFGPRRLFLFGMLVVIVACALTPLATTLAGVCAGRVLLAIGTATAFPSAISMLRTVASSSGVGSTRLLGRLQIANTSGAAIGPVVGGVLVTLLGWQAIFWINVPLAAVTFVGVLLLAPHDPERDRVPLRRTLVESDIPGILLFVAMLTSLLVFLLDLPHQRLWWLLPIFVVTAALFAWRELRASHPFIDLRMLAGNRTLLLVYLCFAIFNVVYYSAFFGLPQYLQESGGYDASAAGVLMFPLAAVTIVVTPFAARAIERFGLRPTLLTGAVTLIFGAALLALVATDTAPWLLLVITAALGIPYCVVSIAMNQSLYAAARPEDAGVAAGIYQTSRYLGAIVATTILGLLFSAGQTPTSWLVMVGVATSLAVVHLGILVFVRPRAGAAA